MAEQIQASFSSKYLTGDWERRPIQSFFVLSKYSVAELQNRGEQIGDLLGVYRRLDCSSSGSGSVMK